MHQSYIQPKRAGSLLQFPGIGGRTLNPRLLFPNKPGDSSRNLLNHLK
jgi:hypothetical protein